MAGIDHAPPPFFKRGPAPLALLTFYIAISLAIFVVDLRFRSLDLLREMLMWVSQAEEFNRGVADINQYYSVVRVNTFSLRRKIALHVIEKGGY